jgi:hypothetical protein
MHVSPSFIRVLTTRSDLATHYKRLSLARQGSQSPLREGRDSERADGQHRLGSPVLRLIVPTIGKRAPDDDFSEISPGSLEDGFALAEVRFLINY